MSERRCCRPSCCFASDPPAQVCANRWSVVGRLALLTGLAGAMSQRVCIVCFLCLACGAESASAALVCAVCASDLAAPIASLGHCLIAAAVSGQAQDTEGVTSRRATHAERGERRGEAASSAGSRAGFCQRRAARVRGQTNNKGTTTHEHSTTHTHVDSATRSSRGQRC